MFRKPLITSAVVCASMILAAGAATAAPCAITDVTFSSTYPDAQRSANACSNMLDGQGNTPNLAALANLWGAGFVEGVTMGSAGPGTATGAANVLGGFQFSLTGTTATTGGFYTLGITDTNGSAAPNLPFYLDFVLYLKSGSADTGAYLFDDALVDAAGGGRWNVTFLNNGNNIGALSNASVYVRNGTRPPDEPNPPVVIPEPTSVALVGLALAAMGAMSRRRRFA